MTPSYSYVPEVLEALAGHGLRPRPSTSPDRVREALSELYRYEIRRLKKRLLAGEFPKSAYLDKVVALRRQYFLLSVPVPLWTAAPRPEGTTG